jgi:hypothetical protein
MNILEMRANDLRKELNQVEAEVAAKSVPLSKLDQAQRDLHEAERLVNLNRGQRAEIEQQITALELKFKRTEPLFQEKRAGIRGEAKNWQDKVRKLAVECEQLEKDVQLKKIALDVEREAIAKNPLYAKVRDEQSKLVPEAIRIANLVFETPLKDVRPVFIKIARLIEQENEIVSQGRAELRRAGLPELTHLLPHFFAQAVPKEETLRLLDNRSTERWSLELREMAARTFRT